MSVLVGPVRRWEHERAGEVCALAYAAEGFGPPGYEARLRDIAGREAVASVLVARDGDSLVGCVTYIGSGGPLGEIALPDEVEFRMLAVDPAAQGRGVGFALVEACAAAGRAAGARALVCCSQDRMAAAHRLYLRAGFERLPPRDWSPVPGVRLLGFGLAL